VQALRNILFLIALAIIGFKLYDWAWPFVDPEGTVEEGSYRGLEIGASKAETVAALRSHTSRLRLSSYSVDDQSYVVPSLAPGAENYPPLTASDAWTLVYPGIHKEVVALTFQDDRLVSIKYHRNAFAP
jgi:hypothetical protein